MDTLFSVSVFSADYLHIANEVEKIDKSRADMIHIDVMDGNFVELYGINQMWVDKIHEICKKPMDIHFMAAVTEEKIKQFDRDYVKTMLFHPEALGQSGLKAAVSLAKERGKRVGIALSPKLAAECVTPYLTDIDEILIMSAYPGRMISEYLPETVGKIREVKESLKLWEHNILLSADGGLSEKTALACIQAGVDKIIIGRCFYRCPNIIEVLNEAKTENKKGEEK